MNRRGFTLIEFIIVMAIIVVFAGGGIYTYQTSVKRAYVTNTEATIRIGISSLDAYFTDHQYLSDDVTEEEVYAFVEKLNNFYSEFMYDINTVEYNSEDASFKVTALNKVDAWGSKIVLYGHPKDGVYTIVSPGADATLDLEKAGILSENIDDVIGVISPK